MEDHETQPESRQSRESSIPPIEALTAIVLIVVVGSLTAIALRSRAKPEGQGIGCAGRQRMIATALGAYVEHNDGMLTPRLIGDGTTYDQLLDPYIGEKDAWRCPDDGSSGRNVRSIGMNRAVGIVFIGPSARATPINTAEIDSPEQLIVFADDAPQEQDIVGKRTYLPTNDPSADYACETVGLTRQIRALSDPHMLALVRHEGRGDFTYVDGHLGFALPAQTLSPRVRWYLRTPALHEFIPGGIHRLADCELLGLQGWPPARDPATGR